MKIQYNVSLARFSTFHIGGNAKYFVEIFEQNNLVESLEFAEEKNIPVFCLGGGSNIIFSDKGFEGLVMQFRNNKISSDRQGILTIESGAKIMEVFSVSKKLGRDFSIFSTIPGTIGGAVAGNAGLPDGEIGEYVQEVVLYDREEKIFISKGKSFFDFQYRSTLFHSPQFAKRYIIWSVVLDLPTNTPEKIAQQAKKYLKTRKEKQPWGKTGGSFFKNPPEGASGYFLEESGLKGFSLPNSQAMFSEKHANFMMNTGTATQQDIIKLGRYAQKKVFTEHGVELKSEVRMLNRVGELKVL